LPPDYLKACLALLAAEAPGSEQGLTCRLAAMGLAGTDCSAVRHALSAMKADGLMEVAVPRPAERTYHLTVDGTSWLRGWGLGAQHPHGERRRSSRSHDGSQAI
jgi:hypothetical protein